MEIAPYYQDNTSVIYHGDCREILPQLEPVDLVLTDPPYGLGENRERSLSRHGLADAIDYGEEHDWDVKVDNNFLLQLIQKAPVSIIWGGNFYDLPRGSWLIWDKLNGDNDFADCEMAWTNLKQAVRLFRHMWNGMLRASERGIHLHPSQKPLVLMIWCLGFVPKAKTILDPYMGSGTTLLAAKNLGRKAIGIDLEEKYCEAAANRLRNRLSLFSYNITELEPIVPDKSIKGFFDNTIPEL